MAAAFTVETIEPLSFNTGPGPCPFSNCNSSSTHVLTGMKSSHKKVEKYIHTNLMMICCSIRLGLLVAYIVDNFIQVVTYCSAMD